MREQSVASAIKRTEYSESRGVGEGNSSVAGGTPKGGQYGRFEVRLGQGAYHTQERVWVSCSIKLKITAFPTAQARKRKLGPCRRGDLIGLIGGAWAAWQREGGEGMSAS